MSILTRSSSWVVALALLALAAIPALGLAATAATFDATQTTANAAASTIPAVTTAGGANEVKATRTMTVTGVPANAAVLFVGQCQVTFDTGATQNIDCADDAAAINTTTDANPNAIASRLRSLQNITDSVHGLLTPSGGGAEATFTTAGTETSTAVITTSFVTGITNNTVNTAGVIAATSTVTIVITDALAANAPDHSVNVDGLGDIDLGTSTLTAIQVAGAIRTGITTDPDYTAKNYQVTGANANIIFTRETAGTAGNGAIALTDASYGGAAQVVTFTPANVGTNDVFSMSINGVSYSKTASSNDNVQSVVEDLNAGLASNTDVTCSENDLEVSCTAVSAGTGFVYTADVTDSSGSSGGGGGGGGHHHSSSDSSASSSDDTDSTSSSDTDTTTTTTTTTGTASFMRDLEVGATGADVMALQVYLNAHGYMVASTGPGSKGNETMFFGALTRAAVIKMQLAAGITPPAGYFGPKTRAYVAAHP